MSDFELTEDQKQEIADEFDKNPDLKHITQTVFKNSSLDGRSKEGRAVRAFLIKNNLDFTTTLAVKAEEIDLHKYLKDQMYNLYKEAVEKMI